jgi:hypothetical protein
VDCVDVVVAVGDEDGHLDVVGVGGIATGNHGEQTRQREHMGRSLLQPTAGVFGRGADLEGGVRGVVRRAATSGAGPGGAEAIQSPSRSQPSGRPACQKVP